MQITGKITYLSTPEEIDGLKKQIIIVEDADKNQIAIDFLGENVKLLEGIVAGEQVTVGYVVKINFGQRIFNRVSGKALTKVDTTQV